MEYAYESAVHRAAYATNWHRSNVNFTWEEILSILEFLTREIAREEPFYEDCADAEDPMVNPEDLE